MTSTGEFNPELLVIARGACGITQADLAKKMEVNQAKVSRWEDGISTPSQEEVEIISDVLQFPSRYFYQPDAPVGPELSFMFHRKRRRITVKELNQLHCKVNIIRMGISRLLRPLEDFPVQIKSMDIDEFGSAQEVAQMVKAAWQIPLNSPIRNFIGLLESKGVIIFRMSFRTDKVDAIHMWPTGMPPLIFLNENCPADRERFSLAHEVGHMILHKFPTPNMEEEADDFAREFLLPEEGLKLDVDSSLTLAEAYRLKHKWKASAQAIIFQSRNIEAISQSKYQSLYKYLSKLGHRKSEAHPICHENPTTINRLVQLHSNDLKYSISELADTVFLNVDRFRRYYAMEEPQSSHLRIVSDESEWENTDIRCRKKAR
ncbi:XRE family transcriptional regulator [uncultured Rubinisphaera sp.]|uniref:XRE family transcriptional regulator n=1 Tax=uncultured Rubinisphaera sp. TaxID=1678686 RepID=UPI0030DCE6D8|tara:strand:+ start:487 stop:1608 length:1122 start_codon:yes stop_codon:yes gene_type:complete